MPKPSPALVVACIALFIAMGGTGYAVTQLPSNSVGTKQLRNNAVTSTKIKDGSIAAADLSPSVRTELKGDTGATGATGAAGGTNGSSSSASVSASKLTGFVLTGAYQAGVTSPAITLTTRSMLVVNGAADLYKSTASYDAVGDATCELQYSSTTDVGYSSIGIALRETAPPSKVTSAPLGYAVSIAISPTGTVLLDPGSYTVRLVCKNTSLDSGSPVAMTLNHATINAVTASAG